MAGRRYKPIPGSPERPVGTVSPPRSEQPARRPKPAQGEIYGKPNTVITDAAEVLLAEIRRTAGHIEWLGEQISYSDPDAFVRSLWLMKRQSGYVRDTEIDTSDYSQAGGMWLELYLTERRHLAAICRTALAAGIEERRVRLAERQAEAIGSAFRGLLVDLGDEFGIVIDPEDDRVRALVYKHLMTASGVPTASAAPERKTLKLELEDGRSETW